MIIRRILLAALGLFFLAALGLATMGTFMHISAKKRQSEVATSKAPGKYVNAGDVDLHYQELNPAGAVTVFFVGGTGAWSENWRREIELAASLGFRAIAIDLPPFGFSTRPTTFDYTRKAQAKRIVEAIVHLQLDKVILVAHSFGASPTITAASLMPEKVVRAMLVDPALGFTTPDATQVGEAPLLAQILFGVLPVRLVLSSVGTYPGMMKSGLERVIYRKEAATPEIVELFQRQMTLQGKSEEMGKWIADFILIRDPEFIEEPAFFKLVTAPVTLLWGDKDDITPLWQGEKLAKLLPNAKLVLLKDVGHVPQIEDSPAFLAALKNFLSNAAALPIR